VAIKQCMTGIIEGARQALWRADFQHVT